MRFERVSPFKLTTAVVAPTALAVFANSNKLNEIIIIIVVISMIITMIKKVIILINYYNNK